MTIFFLSHIWIQGNISIPIPIICYVYIYSFGIQTEDLLGEKVEIKRHVLVRLQQGMRGRDLYVNSLHQNIYVSNQTNIYRSIKETHGVVYLASTKALSSYSSGLYKFPSLDSWARVQKPQFRQGRNLLLLSLSLHLWSRTLDNGRGSTALENEINTQVDTNDSSSSVFFVQLIEHENRACCAFTICLLA